MSNPDVAKESKMVASTKGATKMIKMQAINQFRMDGVGSVRPGQEIEVDESMAAMLERPLPIPYQHTGEASIIVNTSTKLAKRV